MHRSDEPAVGAPAPSLARALEEVVARFAAMVRDVGRRHRLADEDVDELFQDVRIRLWRAGERGEQISGMPTSYVYKTATSAALDLIRRRRRARGEPLETVEGEATLPAPEGASPDRRVMASDLARAVSEAIETITPSRRPVVRLYLRGYGREEIAELLGWSEAKTRNLLYRGLDDLRAALRARGVGPEGR